jgi:hypothetical protein
MLAFFLPVADFAASLVLGGLPRSVGGQARHPCLRQTVELIH